MMGNLRQKSGETMPDTTKIPEYKSMLCLGKDKTGITVSYEEPMPNWWWRMWYWLLLGWKWKKLKSAKQTLERMNGNA